MDMKKKNYYHTLYTSYIFRGKKCQERILDQCIQFGWTKEFKSKNQLYTPFMKMFDN